MIQVEPCKGCGRPLFDHRVANLDVRCETEALDAQEAVAALVAGRELWRATVTGLAPARPAELSALRTAEPGARPHIVRTHRCEATGARLKASQKPGGPGGRPVPPKAPVAPSRPFSGPSRPTSGVPSAANPRFSPQEEPPAPVCDACGHPMAPGTYVSVEAGHAVVWAEHADACP